MFGRRRGKRAAGRQPGGERMTRQEWMATLAKAPEGRLADAWEALGRAPDFEWLRRPETGAVMVRGRAGGTGAPFNLGEMTVTRCTLRIRGGAVGHAHVPGRSRRKVEIAALCDALMQDAETAPEIEARILAPLAEAAAADRAARAEKAAATRVEFFTMARGED
jgi:alpha-D-ribose 1-methylphosphonate 5-triphosphate synthase subunit PhnG